MRKLNFDEELEKISSEYADLFKEFFTSNSPITVENEHIILRLKNYAIEISELELKCQEQENDS